MQEKMNVQFPMEPAIERLFKVGAHFGLSRARRHPSVSGYIFGRKNRIEIFDLEKTSKLFADALEYMKKLGAERKVVLFATGKGEARELVKAAAIRLGSPYISGRWIGGTLTNFTEIRARVERLELLRGERERGEFSKYTKRERLFLDREIDRLAKLFNGLVPMKTKPHALFVVDAKREQIAVREAKAMHVPVIAFSSSDCDLSLVDVPILGNDAAVKSIELVVSSLVDAYEEGVRSRPLPANTDAGKVEVK